MIDALKAWARSVRRDVVALWLAAQDPRVPWYAKAIAAAVAAYALSPIDLVPDFIPVIGYLDDLVIVPLGILLAVRLIPPDLMGELRSQAITCFRPTSRGGLAFIAALWVLSAMLLASAFWPTGVE